MGVKLQNVVEKMGHERMFIFLVLGESLGWAAK